MYTIVLNADYTYLNIVNLKRAVNLIVKEKVEILSSSEKTICNGDRTFKLNLPLVVRLVNMVRTVYRTKASFSKNNLFMRDQYKCQYCGAVEDLSIDHIVPASRGGKTDFTNCVISCITCNTKKGDRTPEEAGMKLLREPTTPSLFEVISYKLKQHEAFKHISNINFG